MGRPFIVEFDDLNMKKFYVCRFCSTPFARSTDVASYKNLPSNVIEAGIVQYSHLKTISNVEFFDIKPDCVIGGIRMVVQHMCCIFCSNKVGIKLREHGHMLPALCTYSLVSERTLFHINGENRPHGTVSPEEWFDPPWPLLSNDL